MTNSTLAALIVVGMMAAFSWFVRSGRFGRLSDKASVISI
jgi:hypothetical protein